MGLTKERSPSHFHSPAFATLADSVKNSPRRVTSQLNADPHAASSSSSVRNGSSGSVSAELRGGSATPAEVKAKPKKKKKGWKGWALVIEDDDGNVLEVRDRGESPDKEEEGEVIQAGSVGPSRGEHGRPSRCY